MREDDIYGMEGQVNDKVREAVRDAANKGWVGGEKERTKGLSSGMEGGEWWGRVETGQR